LNWTAILMDVNGAFLHGYFEKGRRVYMKVPEGFEEYYPSNCVLELMRTLYGTKQAAKAFWMILSKAMADMGFTRSKVDPYLCYKWHPAHGLIVIISWVDDLLIAGKAKAVAETQAALLTHFECDDVGVMQEYVGCKVDRDHDSIKITQPVLIKVCG
jgi:Reverse transcriptase (RNA-dependent DNA polymerase)